ncbi:hypothetical protein ASD85_10520 [Rhizobium sp. Root651]|nr:hypothetical protein ASD85_10520 [Rhizobium sp. Root651]
MTASLRRNIISRSLPTPLNDRRQFETRLRSTPALAESIKLLFKRTRPAANVHGVSSTMLLLIANHGFYIFGPVQGAAACPP